MTYQAITAPRQILVKLHISTHQYSNTSSWLQLEQNGTNKNDKYIRTL